MDLDLSPELEAKLEPYRRQREIIFKNYLKSEQDCAPENDKWFYEPEYRMTDRIVETSNGNIYIGNTGVMINFWHGHLAAEKLPNRSAKVSDSMVQAELYFAPFGELNPVKDDPRAVQKVQMLAGGIVKLVVWNGQRQADEQIDYLIGTTNEVQHRAFLELFGDEIYQGSISDDSTEYYFAIDAKELKRRIDKYNEIKGKGEKEALKSNSVRNLMAIYDHRFTRMLEDDQTMYPTSAIN
ncbi:hypothetical protein JW978_03340 [Candidatus Dojkabacteria bacterium]|nr:hypothetical protein [Candidatus Dojkabacteria bacterium]